MTCELLRRTDCVLSFTTSIPSLGVLMLPPLLRVYEGCARGYIGVVEGANVVRLHRRVPQISYLAYPHFDHDPHPALMGSLVVHLQTLQVRYMDYRTTDSPPSSIGRKRSSPLTIRYGKNLPA